MINNKRNLIVLGAAALASLGLGGQAIAQDVSALDARVTKLETGKFNYQKVADGTVLFDTGSFQLKPEEAAKLDTLVARLKSEDKGVYLEIEGFADPRGGTKENRELSLRRARSVYNHLRDQGVALNRMMLFNQGEEHQLADTGNAENRRVVVTVVQ
jgi:outer membrane protein OmpA-like peptidoglycan-associated protein